MTKFLVALLFVAYACTQVRAQVDVQSHAQVGAPAGSLAGTVADMPLDAMSPQAERGRIQAERDRVEARFAKEQVACYQKFAVNDCVGGARLVRREALADLRRQEVSLNAAQAKRRGAEQLSRIEEKSSPQAELDAANRRAAALEAQQARQAGAEDKAAARSAAGLTTDARVNDDRDRAEKRAEAQAERATKAAAAVLEKKKYDDRQKEAQARAEERRKRIAGPAKSTAKPLEVPPDKSP